MLPVSSLRDTIVGRQVFFLRRLFSSKVFCSITIPRSWARHISYLIMRCYRSIQHLKREYRRCWLLLYQWCCISDWWDRRRQLMQHYWSSVNKSLPVFNLQPARYWQANKWKENNYNIEMMTDYIWNYTILITDVYDTSAMCREGLIISSQTCGEVNKFVSSVESIP